MKNWNLKKTDRGKVKSKMNAYKHGIRRAEIRAIMKLLVGCNSVLRKIGGRVCCVLCIFLYHYPIGRSIIIQPKRR